MHSNLDGLLSSIVLPLTPKYYSRTDEFSIFTVSLSSILRVTCIKLRLRLKLAVVPSRVTEAVSSIRDVHLSAAKRILQAICSRPRSSASTNRAIAIAMWLQHWWRRSRMEPAWKIASRWRYNSVYTPARLDELHARLELPYHTIPYHAVSAGPAQAHAFG